MTMAVGDSIQSKIGKPKRKNSGQATYAKKGCRVADQRIGRRTLGWATRPPVEIMEIDLPGGGVGESAGGSGQGAAARVGSV
jgi:hypothetical protein